MISEKGHCCLIECRHLYNRNSHQTRWINSILDFWANSPFKLMLCPGCFAQKCSSEWASPYHECPPSSVTPGPNTHRSRQYGTYNLKYSPLPHTFMDQSSHSIIHQRDGGYNIQTPPPYQKQDCIPRLVTAEGSVSEFSSCHVIITAFNYAIHQRIKSSQRFPSSPCFPRLSQLKLLTRWLMLPRVGQLIESAEGTGSDLSACILTGH